MIAYRASLAHRAVLLALALVFTLLCSRLALRAREWGPELSAVDRLFLLRGGRPVRDDFVIVGIDRASRLLDRKDRIDRSALASLLRIVRESGARAIVVDLFLPDRTTHAVDRALWLEI